MIWASLSSAVHSMSLQWSGIFKKDFKHSTDLADVPPCQTHQGGEPVRDVQQSFGDPSTAFQQRAVDEGHSADPALPVGTLETHSEMEWIPLGLRSRLVPSVCRRTSTLRPRSGQLLPPVNGWAPLSVE